MSDPYLSEIRIFSFNYAPKGWAMCNGQLLPINQNQALFSLLGTNYGGDGRTNFALPNLMGKTPMHTGTGFNLGQTAGEKSHTLTINEIPSHTHQAVASSNTPSVNTPSNNFWASGTGYSPYNSTPNGQMAPNALNTTGGNQPHENMSPYLVMTICIALQGIFPSRN